MGLLDDLKRKKKAKELLSWARAEIDEIKKLDSCEEKLNRLLDDLSKLLEELDV